jgi:ABC-type polar amino acid transport system ATPase subunit
MLITGDYMLEIREVTKSFGNQLLLEEVNLTVKENKITVLVGKSGEGKTTLFRMITGLDNDYDGQIILSDGSHVGMVYQKFELYPHLSVLNNLVLPQRVVKKASKDEAYKKTVKTLNQLGIMYLMDKTITSLSGGEAQRLAIARTLVMDSNIILLDEPTSALDQENTKNLIELLSRLAQSKTILIITHDIGFAREVADFTYSINNRKIVKHSLI